MNKRRWASACAMVWVVSTVWAAGAGQAAASEPAVEAAAAGDKKLPTFGDLMRIVETKHPLMRAARASLESLQAKLSQADWGYFPTVNVQASAAVTPELKGDALKSEFNDDRYGYLFRARVTFVLPIYTFGKILSLRRAARQGVRIGQAGVQAARWELRYRLAQAWYGAVLAREMRRILDDGRKWLDKASARMERLRKQDSDDYDQNEHLRLKTRMAEFFALDAENKLLETQAQHGLRLLVGEPDPKKVVEISETFLSPLKVPKRSAEAYVALAKKYDPSLNIKRATAKAREFLHDNQKAKWFPDVVLVGEANLATSNVIERQRSSFANNPGHASSFGGLLALRWGFDVPGKVFRAEETDALARAASMDAATTWQLTELNVRKLHQQLLNARMLIGVYEQSKKSAQGWLMANWDLYEDGFGSFNDVMDALVQFYGKKVSYLQTIHQYNLLVHELSRAVGRDITVAPAAQKAPAGGLDAKAK